MYPLQYFRCSLPSAQENIKIARIQLELFAQMQEKCGALRGLTDVKGLAIDFNCGLRLDVPPGNFQIRISDALSKQVFFDEEISAVRLISQEKYAINYQIDVYKDKQLIFSHTLNPAGQTVLFHCSSSAIGDTLAFLPYARLYRDKFSANVVCWVADYLRELVAALYPDIPIVDGLPEDCYAAYYLGTWIDGPYGTPVEGRTYPLWKIAGAITGIYANPPALSAPIPCPPPFSEPYVCIGVEASTPRKGWHYPQGWEIVVNVLQHAGLRVICIDRHTLSRAGDYETRIPANAEDMTGDIPLLERAKILTHAKCFIGLGSGLSWIAYAVGCPVVLISGFSEDYCEFPTPYRVINRLTCHGCFNDSQVAFMGDNVICPYHQGTKRELECSRSIHPDMVLTAAFAAMGLTVDA